jgi:predicted membrane protein
MKRMEHQDPHSTDHYSTWQKQQKQSGRVLGGMLIVLIGIALLMRRIDFIELPYWLFSWKTLMIALGIYIGVRNSFRNIGWFVLVAIGTFFLLDDIQPWFNFRPYFLPLAIIIAGILVITGAGKGFRGSTHRRKGYHHQPGAQNTNSAPHSHEEIIDASIIFGELKRKILSQNFKGGESVTFIGSTEYDLSQADIHGEVSLEIVQTLGRTRLIIPAHWEIRSEIVAILGSVDDKIHVNEQLNMNSGKRLVLKGTSIFGNIEVRTY